MLGVERRAAQSDFKHGDQAGESEVVQAFFERLIFVNDGDVRNLIALVESLDSVLDQLCQLDSAFDGVGDALDHNGVTAWGFRGTSEQFTGTHQITSNTNTTFHSDFIRRK